MNGYIIAAFCCLAILPVTLLVGLIVSAVINARDRRYSDMVICPLEPLDMTDELYGGFHEECGDQ